MAITKTLIANGSKGHHKFTLNVTETRTSGNSSFNDYSFILAPIQKGWDWADWKDKISYEIKFTEKVVNEETNQITINELYKATGTIPAYNGSSTVILSSGSDIEIEHDADGTKTIDISFKVTDNTGATYTCGNASASGIMELTDLHTSPDLSLSSITENNANLSGVSGTTFVTYLSKKKFTVGYTLYDNATAKSIKIYDKVGNELSATITLGTSSATIEVDFSKQNIPANAIANNTTSFSIELTDSMNGKTIITTPDYTVVPYFLPNLITTSSSVKRNGQTTGKALLNLLGSFYNSKIGSKSNSISLSFKYWQSGGTEPSTYNTIPSNVNTGTGNNVSISKWKIAISGTEITNVNKSYTYKFKIKAVDTFGNSSEIELTCSKGEWLIARFKDRVDFKRITQGGINVATINDTQKHILQARINSDQILSWAAWTDVEVPLEEYTKVGNKLTLENNRIKIGAGVSVVRIVGNIRFDINVSNDTVSPKIKVYRPLSDGAEQISYPITAYYRKTAGADLTTNIPEHIISVEEGDYIGMAFQTGQANTNQSIKTGTSLIVEVIE